MYDIHEIRRQNLQVLLAETDGPTALARQVGMSPSQVSNLIAGARDSRTGNQRGMHAKTARRLEEACGRPRGWLDQDHTGTPPQLAQPVVSKENLYLLTCLNSLPAHIAAKYRADIIYDSIETANALAERKR
jgi:hypothetical protein